MRLLACLVAVLGVLTTWVAAQAPAPRLSNGRIDLSGIWLGGGPINDISDGLPKGESLPLLPSAKAILDARQSREDRRPVACRAACRELRLIRGASSRRPRTCSSSSKGTSTATGRFHGRPPASQRSRPHLYGHSVGRWEGDTLVVDTVGFNDKFWFDFKGHPHTERLHIVERDHRALAPGRWPIRSPSMTRAPIPGRSP